QKSLRDERRESDQYWKADRGGIFFEEIRRGNCPELVWGRVRDSTPRRIDRTLANRRDVWKDANASLGAKCDLLASRANGDLSRLRCRFPGAKAKRFVRDLAWSEGHPRVQALGRCRK